MLAVFSAVCQKSYLRSRNGKTGLPGPLTAALEGGAEAAQTKTGGRAEKKTTSIITTLILHQPSLYLVAHSVGSQHEVGKMKFPTQKPSPARIPGGGRHEYQYCTSPGWTEPPVAAVRHDMVGTISMLNVGSDRGSRPRARRLLRGRRKRPGISCRSTDGLCSAAPAWWRC